MQYKTFPLQLQPGIRRDSTVFSSRYWTDGEWVRFQRGMPKKIRGYRKLFESGDLITDIPRGTFVIPQSPNFNIYIGDGTSLKYSTIDQDGNDLGNLVDRTPVGFVGSVYNNWTFDSMFYSNGNGSVIIAHSAPNLYSIDSPTEGLIYYGPTRMNTPLVSTGISVSGGITVLHPYLFSFGNDGLINISNINDPTTIFETTHVSSLKVVAGQPTRAGNSSPGGIFWTLSEVIRATYVNQLDQPFSFDTISDESSILSSNGIVEYDGTYYWAGVDRFLAYQGVVREVPNDICINWFFDNLNIDQRQKVWATKVPEFGEIWWHFPYQGAVECNAAIIYNVREQTWYSSLNINRSSGYFDQVFGKPIWTGNTTTAIAAPFYKVWMHEFGVDSVDNGVSTAIPSFITGNLTAWAAHGPDGQWDATDRWVEVRSFEPDFLQTSGHFGNPNANLLLSIDTREFANSPNQPIYFNDPTNTQTQMPFNSATQKIDLRAQGRLVQFTITSNEVGGYYEMGIPLLLVGYGDVRR